MDTTQEGNKLPQKLQADILSRPTQTILRNENKVLNQEFIRVLRYFPRRKIDIPDEFDGRKAWEGLLTPVMDQGTCGSCWAFASTSVLAERFNIQSMGLLRVQLSPAKLILCDWQGREFDLRHPEEQLFRTAKINRLALENTACYGNSLVDACRYLYQVGTPTEECVPYTKKFGVKAQFPELGTFSGRAQLPVCTMVAGPVGDMCSDFYIDLTNGIEGGTPGRFYKALHFYGLPGTAKDNGGEFLIRDNIFKWGPVATGMKVYPDFYTFDAKNDIYIWNGQGPQVGGHAIELLGWGRKENIDYWIAKNSWGSKWGMDGYFLIQRGVNMCEIEDNCMGMVPDFFYPVHHVLYDDERFDEQENVKNLRTTVATGLDILAGGIDPETGYSRRVMVNMPWLNLQPPIEWENLPDWNKFVAGIDANTQNRGIFRAMVSQQNQQNQQNSNINYGKEISFTYAVVATLLVLAILVVLWQIRKR